MKGTTVKTPNELVGQFFDALRNCDSQGAMVAQVRRSGVEGISQSNISNWLRAYQLGGPQRLRFSKRRAIEDFLATAPPEAVSQADSHERDARGAHREKVAALDESLSELKLEAIRRILTDEMPSAFVAALGPELDDGVLRERFLAAIFDYTDSRVEEISGISHETVRQYREGNWPLRSVNRRTREGLKRFIDFHENRITRLRWEENELPPLVSAMVLLVEEFEVDQEFSRRYPNHGAVSLADSAMKEFRQMGVLTYEDETAWVGFKQGRGYQNEKADVVSMADLGIELAPFLGDRARRQLDQKGD